MRRLLMVLASNSLVLAGAAMVLMAEALVLAGAAPHYQSAEHKLDLIESGQARPGSAITFTPAEINAWARVSIPEAVPEGIRDPHVDLGYDTADGYALIDFLKMRQGKGEATNWLMAKLIQGERPVKISVRLQSAHGRCTVELTRVEISNAAINSTLLDFLIQTFFLPLYPDAKIDEPFDLGYNIDRIEIRPQGISVAIAAAR